MADNTTLQSSTLATPPSGETYRFDDVGGIKYGVSKLDGGGDGLTVPIIAGSQAAAASLPVTASTEDVARAGIVTETAPTTDTASSGLNGRLQRIAQRITSMIAQLPAALGAGGGLKVDGSGTALPVSGTVAVTGVATESTLDTRTGALTETAPATDTASSGINGRLQRIAQRLTSLITALGSPFQAGGSIGNTSFASTQSGTWTVQPGNTANTTAWKVDGSAVTQPVSGTVTSTVTPLVGASSATLANVASLATSVTLQASNAARKMWGCFNDSTQVLYIKFGATASATSYTVQLQPGDYYEMPIPAYTGVIDGIWASANGNARVTEY